MAGHEARRRRVGMARVIGTTVGAFLAAATMATAPLVTAPPARADIVDILDPIIQPAISAVSDALAGIPADAGLDLSSLALPPLPIDLALPELPALVADPAAALSAAADPAGVLGQIIYLPVHALEQDWITSPLGQFFDQFINAPTQLLFGRDLIGNGAAGIAGTATGPNGGPGGAGGFLFGDGGGGGPGDGSGVGGPGGPAGLIGSGGDGGAGGASAFGGAGGLGGWLLGDDGSNGPAGAGAPTFASVALTVKETTEPVVDLSVNGGPSVPVLVDTGSTGLVIPIQDIGLQHLGFPTGGGISGYSGGLNYIYLTFNVPVNFGNGIVTTPTSVDVPILSWPTSFAAFAASDDADGILGIGPYAGGPGPSSVTTALPGDLGQGVLINEVVGSKTVLGFGTNPATTPPIATLGGAPLTKLDVVVGSGGSLQQVSADIDSGGVFGTIPASVIGNVPAGTLISVLDGNQLLYTYHTGAPNAATVTSGDVLDTGYLPFSLHPVYMSFLPPGTGTTFFNSSP